MIPDFQSIMLPLLKFASDGKEHHIKEAIDFLSEKFNLSEEEKKEVLPSGRQYRFDNRVRWAKTYLVKAGLLRATRRGCFIITKAGKKVLKSSPEKITISFLSQFESFEQFRENDVDSTYQQDSCIVETPEELIENGFRELNNKLAIELLDKIKSCSPQFFERLVIDLLQKMGYGGLQEDSAVVTGKSNDGGIDGLINEDKLGLDTIYIQAKRWNNQVPSSVVREFAGALDGKGAKKGVLITTSSFSKEAINFASKILNKKIVLIDGRKLVDLMIEHNVGVFTTRTYEIKK